jgi:hypothetical protein
MRRHVLDCPTECFGLGHAHRTPIIGQLFDELMLLQLFVVVIRVPEDRD